VARTGLDGRLAVLGQIVGRDDDHGGIGMSGLDGFRQVESVIVGQVDIHEYQIGFEIFNPRERSLAAIGLGNGQGRETGTQDEVERLAKYSVVFNYKRFAHGEYLWILFDWEQPEQNLCLSSLQSDTASCVYFYVQVSIYPFRKSFVAQ
jgi:hypothetical protein